MDFSIIFLPILSVFSGALGYIFARRQTKATAKGTELENVSKSLEIYEKLLDNLEARIQAQLLIIQAQETEIDNLRTELKKIKNKC